ncbi:UNVERIFIED_CONTAM: hypothetical protein Sradi_2078800 [Sesamum radiatum]|uniref:Uncharacterized protein n=1 Tax=Sesamum radiatum TaxID=300843 RepID=A0AAW2THH4_SESRA
MRTFGRSFSGLGQLVTMNEKYVYASKKEQMLSRTGKGRSVARKDGVWLVAARSAPSVLAYQGARITDERWQTFHEGGRWCSTMSCPSCVPTTSES